MLNLRDKINEKQQQHADFKARYNVDFNVLLDPEHPDFTQLYQFKDDANENMLMAVRLKYMQRNVNMGAAFCIYHVAKFVLWRYGYFATFFHRTRFLSFPILGAGIWYNSTKSYKGMLHEGKVYEYAQKTSRFNRDMQMLKKFLANRSDYMRESKQGELASTNIAQLINKK